MEVPAASAPMDSAALATARSITVQEEAVSVPVISAASAGMRIFLTICSDSISRDRKAPDGAAGRTTAAKVRMWNPASPSALTKQCMAATFTLRDPVTGKSESVQVHIPAGIDTGKSIRLKGKGGEGYSGGESGDLYLKVTVQEKPGWERRGQDLYTTVNIPYTTAALGGEIRVPTLYGDVMCKVKEGTQSGSKIRLKGKGVVSMKDKNAHGDQYVVIQIQVPKNLTPAAKEKLQEYKKVSGF